MGTAGWGAGPCTLRPAQAGRAGQRQNQQRRRPPASKPRWRRSETSAAYCRELNRKPGRTMTAPQTQPLLAGAKATVRQQWPGPELLLLVHDCTRGTNYIQHESNLVARTFTRPGDGKTWWPTHLVLLPVVASWVACNKPCTRQPKCSAGQNNRTTNLNIWTTEMCSRQAKLPGAARSRGR